MNDWDTAPQPVGAPHFAFPPSSDWPAQDLIALGGDLSPATIVGAYRRGIFPMVLDATDADPMLGWWSPDPRGILPLDALRIAPSLRRSARRFEIRFDTAFAAVMRECADPARENGWITEEFIRAYTRLHDLGWAHSVEAYDANGQLAGGLYGVRIGGLFAGESMFYRQRDASKAALKALVERMRASGMTLLDVQWRTDHLASLGAIAVSRAEYLRLLARAAGADAAVSRV